MGEIVWLKYWVAVYTGGSVGKFSSKSELGDTCMIFIQLSEESNYGT